jgi:hypothetical protein
MADKIVQDVEHAPGGIWNRLRHLNKMQLAALGIGTATLVVGFLAWRSMQSGNNAASSLPTDTTAAGGAAGGGSDPTIGDSTLPGTAGSSVFDNLFGSTSVPIDTSTPSFFNSSSDASSFGFGTPITTNPTAPVSAPSGASIVAAQIAKGINPGSVPGFATPVQPANYLPNPNAGNPNIAVSLVNQIVAAAQKIASPAPPSNPNAGNPQIAVHTVQAIVAAAQATQHQATPAPLVPIATASVSGKRSGGNQMVV